MIFKISDINLDGLESVSIQIEMVGGFENHGRTIGIVDKNGIYKFDNNSCNQFYTAYNYYHGTLGN